MLDYFKRNEEKMERQNTKSIFHNINFIRFIFSVIIVYFHMTPHIAKLITDEQILNIYNIMRTRCESSNLIVEMFFIVAGYFLFKNIISKPQQSWFEFAWDKVCRLWPVLAFAIACSFLLDLLGVIRINAYTNFINLFFFQCIGITLAYKGINWYISSYFAGILFYGYILKSFKPKYANLIIALCTYFALVATVNHFNGHSGRETFAIVLNGGVLRALYGIGIGYFIALLQETCKKHFKPIKDTIITKLIVTGIEGYCLVFLINNLVFHKNSYSNQVLLFMIVFSILFYTFIAQKGFISRLLNQNWLGFCGKYAYSIYAMQQIAFYLLGATLWKNSSFITNIPLCISVSLIFATVLGIATYYLIEQPIGKKMKNCFIQNQKIQP